jgi:muramoyltetrapeptide carboxypeptidase
MARPFKPLESGEPIGVVALSGPVDRARLSEGLAELESWGHPVLVAPNVSTATGYLAGTDEERLRGLEWVLDRGARVVVAARGGFGVTRLMTDLDIPRLAADGVTFVGYSDLTALLNGVVVAGGCPQIHGPMVAAGMSRPGNALRLHQILTGDRHQKPLFEFDDGNVVRPGRAVGRSVGGNLALVEASLGTSYEPDFDNSVLFLEEVGEPPYRLDRMLTHLRASARLRRVKALICGSLRGCRPARDTSRRWRELVAEIVPQRVPVVVALPFGHGAVNRAFPIGSEVDVDTSTGVIRWRS